MPKIKILCLLCIFGFSSSARSAPDETWERIEVLGHTPDGSKLLVFRSHFGPSSRAPFAKLELRVAGTSTPAIQDELSAFEGDEATMSNFRQILIDRNRNGIAAAGVSLEIAPFADATSVTSDNEIVVEADLYRGGHISRFHLNYAPEPRSECGTGQGRPLRIASLDQSPVKYFEPDLESFFMCGIERYRFSRLAIIGETAWLFIFAPVEVMPDLFYSQQVVYGLPFPRLNFSPRERSAESRL